MTFLITSAPELLKESNILVLISNLSFISNPVSPAPKAQLRLRQLVEVNWPLLSLSHVGAETRVWAGRWVVC